MKIDALPKAVTSRTTACVHGRLIDGVRTKSGKPTGEVRCLECGATFDDPGSGMESYRR